MTSNKVDMKIVLLGKEFGGKTSLVERYLHERFGNFNYQATIGAAFGARKMKIGGKTITLGIWDTAGSEKYESMSRIYYRGAKAAIVCYDLTDPESFDRAKFWVNELRENEEECKIYLCGTKNDLVKENRQLRRVDFHNITDYADGIGAKVHETSSKTGEGVEELFNNIAEDYSQTNRKIAENPAIPDSRFQLQDTSTRREKLCCVFS